MAERTVAEVLASYVDMREPEGLGAVAVQYLTWMAVAGYSPESVKTRTPTLGVFLRWCEQRGIQRVAEVSVPVVERYQRWLHERRQADGRPLALRTQVLRLAAVQCLFKWLVKQQQVPSSPAADLVLPRLGRRLPRGVLTYDEVERLLGQADVTRPTGLRDRAMMEVFYSTGLRRQEVTRLCLQDLVPERGTALVREGKGRRDRVVPVGARALEWVRRWLVEARPALVVPPDEGHLFVTCKGRPLTPNSLTCQMRVYMVRAGLGSKGGACHVLRHTMATLMLENGADIRYIQEMLGHTSLATTEIYTHVSILKLKEVHSATHPAEVGLLNESSVPKELREQLSEALASEEDEESS